MAVELHGMLSRWLFNHIRNEDHGYIDSVKAYQRMSANNGIAERDKLNAEVIAQLREERGRHGIVARDAAGDLSLQFDVDVRDSARRLKASRA